MLRKLFRTLNKPAGTPDPAPADLALEEDQERGQERDRTTARDVAHEPAALETAPMSIPLDPYAASGAAEQRGDLAGAEALLRDHAQAHPDDVAASASLGAFLFRHERLDEAQAVLAPALRRFPDAAPLLFNTGRVAQARLQVDQAISLYRLAVAAEPGFAAARHMLGLQLFLKGEYPEAFLHMRTRNELSGAATTAWPRSVPRWSGESLAGKRLLAWLDWGGLGDEIQFARYLPMIARQYRPGTLIAGCSQQSLRLLSALPGVDQAYSEMSNIEVDYQVSLFDLPTLFGTTVASVPAAAGYLAAAPEDVRAWAARLAPLRGLRVGLCWGAGYWGAQRTRSDKAIPLELLAPLADLADTHFICLQKGQAREEMPCPGMTMHDYDANLEDMADTAALIANLDLVISVDTSVAHLAGALGKPVLMPLKWASGNFWLLDTEDSPWYASMRIVRQPAAGDWNSVADHLLTLVAGWARPGRR